jgi:hypothetical protein
VSAKTLDSRCNPRQLLKELQRLGAHVVLSLWIQSFCNCSKTLAGLRTMMEGAPTRGAHRRTPRPFSFCWFELDLKARECFCGLGEGAFDWLWKELKPQVREATPPSAASFVCFVMRGSWVWGGPLGHLGPGVCWGRTSLLNLFVRWRTSSQRPGKALTHGRSVCHGAHQSSSRHSILCAGTPVQRPQRCQLQIG